MKEARGYLIELAVEEMFEMGALEWDGSTSQDGHYLHRIDAHELLSLIGRVLQRYYPKVWGDVMERDGAGSIVANTPAAGYLAYVKGVIREQNKRHQMAAAAARHGLLGYVLRPERLGQVEAKLANLDINAGSGLTQKEFDNLRAELSRIKRVCMEHGIGDDEELSLLSEPQVNKAMERLDSLKLKLSSRRIATPCPFNYVEQCKGNLADSFGMFQPCRHTACTGCIQKLYQDAALAAGSSSGRICPICRQPIESYTSTGASPPSA